MKILFISPYLLMPNIGAHIGSLSHLNAIKKVFNEDDICTVAINPRFQKQETMLPINYIINAYKSKAERTLNFFLLNGLCANKKVRTEILRIIRENNISVVFIDESILGKLCKDIKTAYSHIKIIAFFHDIKADLCRQWIKQNGLKSIPYNSGLIYNEQLTAKYADKIAVLNDRDESLYQHYYGDTSVFYLPHTVIEKKIDFTSYNIPKTNKLRLLFVGADYYPNVQGIEWFIHNVISEIDTISELNIIGKNMQKYAKRFNQHGVTVIGTVDELDSWYINADVVISPIFVGGGMKTKTAEAFQFGKRIIATSESYEGYRNIIPKEFWNNYCYEANSKEEFVAAIKDINASKDTIQKQAYEPEIIDLFERNFSAEACKQNMLKIIGEYINA